LKLYVSFYGEQQQCVTIKNKTKIANSSPKNQFGVGKFDLFIPQRNYFCLGSLSWPYNPNMKNIESSLFAEVTNCCLLIPTQLEKDTSPKGMETQ
jgi:hypothetical protein